MPTYKAYVNGFSMGVGNPDPKGGQRGTVAGFTKSSQRNLTRKLFAVDSAALDGDGFAVTLTVRDCPPDSDEWHRMRKVLDTRLRRAGFLRWCWVVEWQRRRVPHLHLTVYVPIGWEPPISDIMSTTAKGAESCGFSVIKIH